MHFAPIHLEGFDGREAALAHIKRYIHFITPVMFYRTNDLIHSRRVLWHLEEAIPDILAVYGNDFNVDFARTLAFVHDDVEILTGDVQLHDKEHMSGLEREVLAQKEHGAIPHLVRMYSTIANGHDYGALLLAAKEKSCLEAHFVSFFDKFDGAGEAWHEVFAGNHCFLRPAGGNEGQSGGYVRRLRDFSSKYADMTRFFAQFPHYLPPSFDFRSAADRGKPHTPISLESDSGYLPYERWKKTIIKREGVALLTTQAEFPLPQKTIKASVDS